MWNLIRNGGVPAMLFILITGFVGLGAALYFAFRAKKQTLGFIKGMAMATLFGTLAATCADVGATLNSASRSFGEPPPNETPSAELRREAEGLPRALHIVMEGFSESTSPGVLGFPFLGLMAMLTGIGRRRLDARSDV